MTHRPPLLKVVTIKTDPSDLAKCRLPLMSPLRALPIQLAWPGSLPARRARPGLPQCALRPLFVVVQIAAARGPQRPDLWLQMTPLKGEWARVDRPAFCRNLVDISQPDLGSSRKTSGQRERQLLLCSSLQLSYLLAECRPKNCSLPLHRRSKRARDEAAVNYIM